MFRILIFLAAYGLLNVVLAGKTNAKCGPNEFACENGKKCIPLLDWCDAKEDCDDDSDEKYCEIGWIRGRKNKCPLDKYFKCKSGICIPKSGLCDGFDSCHDGSDEVDCQTSIAEDRPKSTTSLPPDHGVHEFKKIPTEFAKNPSYISSREIEDMRKRAAAWLYHQQNEDNSWGENTHRAIIALQLAKADASENLNPLLMKQLELNLAVDLSRNSTKPISLTDLSLYINALLSICKCPNSFHGYNLVQTLRDRVDAVYQSRASHLRVPKESRASARISSQNSNSYSELYPLVLLTLCINNMTNTYDVNRLQELTTNMHPLLDKIDILSMGLMAAKCMMTNSTSHTRHDVKPLHDSIRQKIYYKIQAHGYPGNVYEAAILYQAFRDHEDAELQSRTRELILSQQTINGSFGDLLSTYYVLPILSGRSLLSLPESCQQPLHPEHTSLEVIKNMPKNKMVVYVELEYGIPLQYSLNLRLYVPAGINMVDLIRLAEENNPDFSFKMDNNRETPVIYSIGDIPNDAERGMYWCIYYKRNQANSMEMITLKNAQNVVLKDGDLLKYWYRPL